MMEILEWAHELLSRLGLRTIWSRVAAGVAFGVLAAVLAIFWPSSEKAPEPANPTPAPRPSPSVRPLVQITLNWNDHTAVYTDQPSLPLPGGGNASVVNIGVTSPGSGDNEELQAILLFDDLAWTYGRSDSLDGSNPPSLDRLVEILNSEAFVQQTKDYKEIWLLGLVSGEGNCSDGESAELSFDRAVRLCSMIAGMPRWAGTAVFGLPLGAHRGVKPGRYSDEERRQRAIVIFGVLKETGAMDQKKVFQDMLRNNGVRKADGSAVFPTRDYELVVRDRELLPVRVTPGSSPRTCDNPS